MRALNSASSTGLLKSSFAPDWRPLSFEPLSVSEVTITMGRCMVAGSFFRLRVTSKPFMPGMTTSIMRMSGWQALTFSMASVPFEAEMLS